MADQTNNTFDVLVVGSGASGGWASKRLSEAGLKVCLIDAGRKHTDKDFREHLPPFALKYRDPTLTIMTLCVRSMDYLMGEMKRGNI